MQCANKEENATLSQGQKAISQDQLQLIQVLEPADKDFKTTIIIINDVKENRFHNE